jgi:hypothetical protein
LKRQPLINAATSDSRRSKNQASTEAIITSPTRKRFLIICHLSYVHSDGEIEVAAEKHPHWFEYQERLGKPRRPLLPPLSATVLDAASCAAFLTILSDCHWHLHPLLESPRCLISLNRLLVNALARHAQC